jgi:hypothetical protein
VSYSGIVTMTDPGNSWVARFGANTSVNTALESPPSGHTLRTNLAGASAETVGFDTNGAVSSSSFANVTVGGTSGNWITKTLEILAQPSTDINVDNVSQVTVETGTTAQEWSHTVTSNTNGILLVSVGYTGSSTTVSSVTYNGVTMTATATRYAVTSSYFIEQYYLLAPATGTHTISVTYNNTTRYASGGAVSLTGVMQSAPEVVTTTNGASFGSVGGNITTLTSGAWIVDVFGVTSSASTYNGVNIPYHSQADATNSRFVGSQYGGPTTAGTNTSNWVVSGTANRTWGHIMASIAPYSVGGSTPTNLFFRMF